MIYDFVITWLPAEPELWGFPFQHCWKCHISYKSSGDSLARLKKKKKKSSNSYRCFLWSCIVFWPPRWFSSSPATTFFFVCSSSFYHTGLRDLPNLMRGLAHFRSLLHLQMQFLMPGVKVTTFSEIHLKLAAECVILGLIWGPESGQESQTGSEVPCFDSGRRLIVKLWMQVHGDSRGNPDNVSSLWDFRWVYRYMWIFLLANIFFFVSFCEYLLFYIFGFFLFCFGTSLQLSFLLTGNYLPLNEQP